MSLKEKTLNNNKKKEQNEYSMRSILEKKSMSLTEEQKKETEERLTDINVAGKRNTRNQILKGCEVEENFKKWKKNMMKEAGKTETKADDNFVSALKQTSKMFEDILYDEGVTLDDSMPDYGDLSKYM